LSRIRRHHALCELLAAEAERVGWKVDREKRRSLPNGKDLAPDMICLRGDTALIIDSTVRYELNGDSPESKYLSMEGLVKEKNPRLRKVAIFGFPLGNEVLLLILI